MYQKFWKMLVGWIKLVSQLLAIFHPFILIKILLVLPSSSPAPVPCSGPLPLHSGLTGCLLICQTCSCLKNLLYFLSGTFPVEHSWLPLSCFSAQMSPFREIFLVYFFLLPFCLSIQPSSHPSIQFSFISMTLIAFTLWCLGAGNTINKQMTSLLTDDFSCSHWKILFC